MNKKVLILDGDSIAYRCAAAGETECYSDVDIKLFHEIISKIKEGKPNEV